MEDPINRKNIIIVFVSLVVIFLFVYKGIILSGDEYLDEYNSFTAYTQKQSQAGMKKGNIALTTSASASSTKKDNSALNLFNKKVYDVLQNLEDLKLSLGAMEHNIKMSDNLIEDSLSKIIAGLNSTNIMNTTNANVNNANVTYTSFNSSQLRGIIKDLEERKVNVEPIMDNLNGIIESLRNIVKDNN